MPVLLSVSLREVENIPLPALFLAPPPRTSTDADLLGQFLGHRRGQGHSMLHLTYTPVALLQHPSPAPLGQ